MTLVGLCILCVVCIGNFYFIQYWLKSLVYIEKQLKFWELEEPWLLKLGLFTKYFYFLVEEHNVFLYQSSIITAKHVHVVYIYCTVWDNFIAIWSNDN